MNIKIKKLHPDAVIPSKATPQSGCYDVSAFRAISVRPGRQVLPLGLAIELPEGYVAEIRPRSGYDSKGFPGTLNSHEYRFDCQVLAGVVDADYRGEIGVIVYNHENRSFLIRKGQRIAQMLIIKAEEAEFEEVAKLGESKRTGGFGSTGA